MYSPNNEYSLNLFTDYRTKDIPAEPTYRIEGASTEPTIMDVSGWMADFNTKTITVSKPIKFVDLYSGVCDMLDDFSLMEYSNPIMAITKNLFEFVGGWTFLNDNTRKNIREAGWTEGDEQWVCIKPIGCTGDISGLAYKWDWGNCGEWSTFSNIATLTSEDSGLISEPIKVKGTPSQLSININGKDDFRDMESLYGITNFNKAGGVIVVPVGWYPPAPEISTEPYHATFTVSGVCSFDNITLMPYNDA